MALDGGGSVRLRSARLGRPAGVGTDAIASASEVPAASCCWTCCIDDVGWACMAAISRNGVFGLDPAVRASTAGRVGEVPRDGIGAVARAAVRVSRSRAPTTRSTLAAATWAAGVAAARRIVSSSAELHLSPRLEHYRKKLQTV